MSLLRSDLLTEIQEELKTYDSDRVVTAEVLLSVIDEDYKRRQKKADELLNSFKKDSLGRDNIQDSFRRAFHIDGPVQPLFSDEEIKQSQDVVDQRNSSLSLDKVAGGVVWNGTMYEQIKLYTKEQIKKVVLNAGSFYQSHNMVPFSEHQFDEWIDGELKKL